MALRFLGRNLRRPWVTASVVAAAGGAGVSVAAEKGYIDWSSVGIVRFGRAFFAVSTLICGTFQESVNWDFNLYWNVCDVSHLSTIELLSEKIVLFMVSYFKYDQ